MNCLEKDEISIEKVEGGGGGKLRTELRSRSMDVAFVSLLGQ